MTDGPKNTSAKDSSAKDGSAVDPLLSTATLEASLTQRQREVLEVIRSSVRERGYPPSIREIGEAVGLTSTSSVAHQLRTLERRGLLKRDPHRPRAVNVREDHRTPPPGSEPQGAPGMPKDVR